MIDEDRTEQLFGYKSTDLTPKANKKIVVVCEECGTYRVINKSDYAVNKHPHLCRACASVESRKDPIVREKISDGVKQAHKDDPTLGQRKTRKGKNNINYKGKVEIPCSYCGNTLSLYPNEIKTYDNHFCNGNCYGKWRSENTCGENNSRWKGGVVEYCEKFNRTCRISNREKYDNKCFLCGLDQSDNMTSTGKQWNLSVHHVDMNKNQGCDDHDWNLVPLCIYHHGVAHGELWTARIEYLLNNIWS